MESAVWQHVFLGEDLLVRIGATPEQKLEKNFSKTVDCCEDNTTCQPRKECCYFETEPNRADEETGGRLIEISKRSCGR